ncbi:MAG: hypothetical protein OHK0018_00550 [Erythrobacter tepidarius]
MRGFTEAGRRVVAEVFEADAAEAHGSSAASERGGIWPERKAWVQIYQTLGKITKLSTR